MLKTGAHFGNLVHDASGPPTLGGSGPPGTLASYSNIGSIEFHVKLYFLGSFLFALVIGAVIPSHSSCNVLCAPNPQRNEDCWLEYIYVYIYI